MTEVTLVIRMEGEALPQKVTDTDGARITWKVL